MQDSSIQATTVVDGILSKRRPWINTRHFTHSYLDGTHLIPRRGSTGHGPRPTRARNAGSDGHSQDYFAIRGLDVP
jgi:hypothetical protein